MDWTEMKVVAHTFVISQSTTRVGLRAVSEPIGNVDCLTTSQTTKTVSCQASFVSVHFLLIFTCSLQSVYLFQSDIEYNNNGFICIAARMLDYTIAATQDSACNIIQIIITTGSTTISSVQAAYRVFFNALSICPFLRFPSHVISSCAGANHLHSSGHHVGVTPRSELVNSVILPASRSSPR